jgi:hypothetical protein
MWQGGQFSDKFLLGNMDIATSITSIFIAHNDQFPWGQCVQTHLIMNLFGYSFYILLNGMYDTSIKLL